MASERPFVYDPRPCLNPRPQLRRGGRVARCRAAKSTVREYAEALGVALLLALVIRTFVVQAFKIPSGSMLPTLQIGDHILVNKFIYGPRLEVPLTQWSLGQLPGLREPRAGDVVVFIYPKERDKDFIKRVVAVAGQTVEIRAATGLHRREAGRRRRTRTYEQSASRDVGELRPVHGARRATSS